MVLKIDSRIFKIDARIFDIDARIFKIDARIRIRFWRLVHLAAELRTPRFGVHRNFRQSVSNKYSAFSGVCITRMHNATLTTLAADFFENRM
jgi:hypothetical protein